MRKNASFVRKVVYICLIAVLLIPLSWLGRPATGENAGGKLAQMRADYGLSQTQLGDIDPAGEAMKLSTLGLQGVAANVLWNKSIYYKKTKQWNKFRATLNQITKLQPNFVAVWRHQAWNLSFNISVEFDDYKYRYHWVKKGIEYMLDGVRLNRNEPRILWDAGWFFGQKFGRADERVAYREMFRKESGDDTRAESEFITSLRPFVDLDDPVENAKGPDGTYDNWLIARLWFLEAQNVVDTKRAPIRGTSPLVFHSHSAMAAISFAEVVEEEGHLDEPFTFARQAWRRAHGAWSKYGDRDILSSYGIAIRLNDRERLLEDVERLSKRLDELVPGGREEVQEEKLAELTQEQRDALAIEPDQRTQEQHFQAQRAVRASEVTAVDVALRAPAEVRDQARRLALDVELARRKADITSRYRDTINYYYWTTRCEAEQKDFALKARKFLYDARQAFEAARLEEARELYEKAWDHWADLYDGYPILLENVTAKDVLDEVHVYRSLLDQLDEKFPPPDFKLMRLLEFHDEEYYRRANTQVPDESEDRDVTGP